MGLFKNLIGDLATETSNDYQKENQSYMKVQNEIKAIDDLLDCALTSEIAINYPFTWQDEEMDLYSFKSLIESKKIEMFRSSSSMEYRRLEQKVKSLEEEYKILYRQVKDVFLSLDELVDIQNHVRNLNSEMYQNARLEAYKNFVNPDLLKKKWTTEELELLKDNISRRREIITYYLGNLKR